MLGLHLHQEKKSPLGVHTIPSPKAALAQKKVGHCSIQQHIAAFSIQIHVHLSYRSTLLTVVFFLFFSFKTNSTLLGYTKRKLVDIGIQNELC